MNAVKQTTEVAGILKRLGIDSINAGAWSGSLGWSKDTAGSLVTSQNPATGEVLAQVRGATVTDYEAVMRSAVEAATAWRAVPAPQRGEAVRLLGEALRAAKQDLGALVTLENGKIRAEGLG
jgi:aldehyde dehydrogenase (NAD+)